MGTGPKNQAPLREKKSEVPASHLEMEHQSLDDFWHFWGLIQLLNPALEHYLRKKTFAFKILLLLDITFLWSLKMVTKSSFHAIKHHFYPPRLDQEIVNTFKSHYTQELYCNVCQHLNANPDSTMDWRLNNVG